MFIFALLPTSINLTAVHRTIEIDAKHHTNDVGMMRGGLRFNAVQRGMHQWRMRPLLRAQVRDEIVFCSPFIQNSTKSNM